MKFTKIDDNIQRSLVIMLAQYPLIQPIVDALQKHGGLVYLVGGAVRDLLLGLPVKDLDIEVHNLTIAQLEDLLSTFGPVSLVGKIFGVLRVHGLDVDWSLPRSDEAGRKPEVRVDPYMDITQALRRRDLTMNAMAINLAIHELIDPFDGVRDMEEKILRTPDEHFFIEDPLRFYRVMQFVARFEMYPDKALNNLCSRMDLQGVSKERISDEFDKMWLKAKRPALGIRWLHDISRLNDILPEVSALVGVKQNPQWHPEGDVFEHTMQVIDAAARFECQSNHEKLIMLLTALCHDLGKAKRTKLVGGAIKSIGHAQASVPLTKQLLKRITIKKDLIASVCTLVRYHMQALLFIADNAGPAAYKRLAKKMAPYATLRQLAMLALADRQARNPQKGAPLEGPDPDVELFIKRAQEAFVLQQTEQPILQGRDLMDLVKPGPYMGELLKYAYDLQIEEGIKDKDELKRRVAQKIKETK